MTALDSAKQPPPAHHSLVWRALIDDPKHGPLPALLLTLTVVTGAVDAVSILSLGRVFVANMTGNVVFVGFAIAGAPGFSLSASLVALAGFLVGAGAGGQVAQRLGTDRARLLRAAASTELVLLSAALIMAIVSHEPFKGAALYGITATMAVAMGIQNAAARRLAVPDLTTTVLTMTLTGLAADLKAAHRGPPLLRRLLAVATMLGGAVAGAELVEHGHSSSALALAVGLLAVVAGAAIAACRQPTTWRQA